MSKIVEDDHISSLPKNSVLVGGCFDVLHPGHIEFLKRSKSLGKTLHLLLESDESISKKKGTSRPLNTQIVRAQNLSKIEFVDEIILLKNPKSSQYYYNLVKLLHPDIIAVTSDDPLLKIKQAQADMIGGRVVEVMQRDKRYSTSQLIKNR